MKRQSIYADTSVFGGCFDREFADPSRKLFDEIREGRFLFIVSATTMDELDNAPEHVQALLPELPEELVTLIEPSEEIERLRDAYLRAGVVGVASAADAEHIAAASVAGVDIIVSWNFRHIVHFEKIRGYHAINLLHGYPLVAIHTPLEVIEP